MKERYITLTGTVSRCRWNHSIVQLSLLTNSVIRNQNGNLFSDTKWYSLNIIPNTIPIEIIETIGKGDKITIEGIENNRIIKDKNGWYSLDNTITVTKIIKERL